MILKYKTTRREDYGTHGGNYDVWNFIDNVKACSLYFDPDAKCTCIEIGEGLNHMVLALHDEAYLINDNGKTIEKIK